MVGTGLPTGTVTLLFTDVEGSTRLLHELGDAPYAAALAEHRRLLRSAFARNEGTEVDTQGDAFFVAFPSAERALQAADEARAALEPTLIRIRVGVHTGRPLRVDEGYVGADVHRAARIAAAGHGGQILVSSATAAHAPEWEAELVDLGEHRLKDLAAPERIYQLGTGAFAPLQALSVSNLPVPAIPLQGRADELRELVDTLRSPARLITVTGPGGIGKTRLALQAAAESSDAFPDGLWWVGLASVRDSALALSAIAEALEVREEDRPLLETLAERLRGRRLLLLLDNAEHLLPDLADGLAGLLQASDGPTLLVTSRERLHLTAEQVVVVPPLTSEDARVFFQARAAAHGVAVESSDALAELCERLDRLPLALQLAAARARTFSVEQLLVRLGDRLDLLRGERDLEPRQRTLRATVEWSHDLLSEEEKDLFRRFSVFMGGATLTAVESVCSTGPDVLEALVDRSLVQHRDDDEPRFWQLETLRDFAAERLAAAAGEAIDVRRRHAEWFRGIADEAATWTRSGEPEEVAVRMLETDIDNLRAAVTFALEVGDVALVREVSASLLFYWIDRGLYTEARTWLERALVLDDRGDPTRLRLLSALGTIAYAQGDHRRAVEASDAAGDLAMSLAGTADQFERLDALADAALMRGDLTAAEELLEGALAAATEADNGVGMSACRLGLTGLAMESGRLDRAAELLGVNLPFVRSRGQTRCEGFTLASLARLAVHRGQVGEALAYAAEGGRRAVEIEARGLLATCLDYSAAGVGESRTAALLLGASGAAREQMGIEPSDAARVVRDHVLEAAERELGREALESALAEGGTLGLVSAYELVSEQRGRGASLVSTDAR